MLLINIDYNVYLALIYHVHLKFEEQFRVKDCFVH